MDIKKEYERWLANATADADVVTELKTLDDAKIEDAFYRDLAFGTGGLRGVIGAGTNRMNVYTVAKASQGLADYLKKNFETPSVAIGYDSRIKSDVFAKVAAGVFAANGVKVNIWPVLMPVPTVSFATRYLHTSAGVMVTASHNPSKYNGYKVYGADGCQITTEAAAEILAEIEKLDIFADVKTSDFEAGVANGSIQYIPDEVYTAFVEQVKSQSVLFGEEVNKNVAIVYSPLNGTGLKPVTRTLKEMGYTNITVVKEQEQPDGSFPTCPYPNPEIKEAMALGMEYAKKCNADLLLATDPDCDRVGIAVKNKAGEYELLTGNQTGMLLLDYICSQRVKHGKMPADPVMVKTIVTMDMGEQIATHYGLSVQVHPDDAYAREHEGDNGKTEMWYVIDADEGASLIYGFQHKVTEGILRKAVETGTLGKHLQKVPVHKGDTYFVPAGTVHGIGKGILVAEIQESSNVTYRVYDYDRVDKNGKKRELHFDKAVQVMDMNVEPEVSQKARSVKYYSGCSRELLCRCKYFETERIQVTKGFAFSVMDTSFQVLMCLNGYGEVQTMDAEQKPMRFSKGETLFLPAGLGRCLVVGDAELIKVRC